MDAHIATSCSFVMSNRTSTDLPGSRYPRKQWLGNERGSAGHRDRVI